MQHVGFINRGDDIAAFAGGLEGDTGDAFDLKAVVDLGIKGALMHALAFTAFGLAEVDAAS
ncbi:hypothetical protein D3C75_1120450 [compost metagenome]